MPLPFVKHENDVVYSTAEEEMLKEEAKLQQQQDFIDEMEFESERQMAKYGDYLDWV